MEYEECERGVVVVDLEKQNTDAAAIELPEVQACMCGQPQNYNRRVITYC